MKLRCELNQAQWLSQLKPIVTMTQMWTEKSRKRKYTMKWDRAARKLMSQCSHASVASLFTGGIRDEQVCIRERL